MPPSEAREMRLVRIGVGATSLVAGASSFGLGLLASFVWLLVEAGDVSRIGRQADTAIANRTLELLVVTPVLAGVGGVVAGWVGAVVFNWTANALGGVPLRLRDSPARVPSAKPCPACGAPLRADRTFCPDCGYDIEPGDDADAATRFG